MPRSSPPAERYRLPHDGLLVAASAVLARDPRSPMSCRHPTSSGAAEAAKRAKGRPPPRSSGAHLARHMSAFQLASAGLLERTGDLLTKHNPRLGCYG